MKITVDINGKPTEITLTEEQVASIEAQNKPKKFEWKYQRNNTYSVTVCRIGLSYSGKDEDYIEHGRYRLTRKVAEKSLLRNKRANRLEALAEQLCGLKKFVAGDDNYYIYYFDIRWEYSYNSSYYSPEKVYMTKECAKEICRMLNEGEFSLDGEL